MARHLIVLGFAKCGTSLLHETLKNCPEFHLPTYKETNFFSWDWHEDLNRYYYKYPEPQRAMAAGKIFFDSSPTYFGKNYPKVLERIKSTLGDSAKFIICLRNPIYRAFSHYKHQINAHYARYGFFAKRQTENFKQVYNQSFFDSEVLNNKLVFDSYLDKIVTAQQILGKDNILYFSLEKDTKNFDGFYRQLCDFLKTDYQPYFAHQPLSKVLVGDYISHYRYAPKDLIFHSDRQIYRIPQGGLFLFSNRGHELFTDLSQDKILACLSASQRWTKVLPEAIARQLFELKFADDSSKLETLIDFDFSTWTKFKTKVTPLAEFQPQYLENSVWQKAEALSLEAPKINQLLALT